MEGEAFYGDGLKKTIISNLILPEQKKKAIFIFSGGENIDFRKTLPLICLFILYFLSIV